MKLILNKKRLRNDYIIAIIILTTPFLFYTYMLFPAQEHIKILWLKYTFPDTWDLEYAVWNLFSQLIVLIFFSLWFVSCTHWWRYAILISVFLSVRRIYALFIILYNDFQASFNEVHAFFFACLVLVFLIYKANKLNYYSSDKKLKEDLFDDLVELINNNNLSHEEYENALKKTDTLFEKKDAMSSMEYINSLIGIKKQIELERKTNA